MPPKKDEKKEIVSAFKPDICWQYQQYNVESQEKADTFLTTFANQLKVLIVPEQSLQQNYRILAEKMGINIHPCLAIVQKEQEKFPQLKSTDYGQKYITFLNHKIDILTLKLFGFLTTYYKVNTIKFSNNSLGHEAVQLRKLIQKQDSLTNLYFQWNPLLQIENRQSFFPSLVLPSLQHLILRECKMGNEICTCLIKKILETNPNLVSLDLYANNLNSQIQSQIVKLLQQSCRLQFLGLSKNQLNSHQFLKNLFNSIGQIPIDEEEYQNYKLKLKEREEIIEKNKKRKKGAPEQPVPFLFQLKETENGRFYVKNTKLKFLNIASNGIKDVVNKESNVKLIKNFVQNQGKNVDVFIEGNNFSKKTKEVFKFCGNLYL